MTARESFPHSALDTIGKKAESLSLGGLSRDERALMSHTTDGDRMAWLDAHRGRIEIGLKAQGASIEYFAGAWELIVRDGPDLKKTKHATLREAVDAMRDATIPDGKNTCSCGATIAEDETSCTTCRDDENWGHQRELESQFPDEREYR